MNRNSFILGVGIGVVAPLIAHILYLNYADVFLSWNKQALAYIIAAVVNLVVLRFYYRKGFVETGKGIIMVTFIAGVVLFLFTDLSVS